METLRFAPSPTGYLHIGNARTALWNWLIAKKSGGTFILRLDDTDTERSREEFAAAIIEDLAWLGIKPDRIERQSARVARYGAELERLKSRGLIYPAYETADELDRKRKRQQARGLPPVYDRAALKLGEAERAALEAEGRKPHWRLKLSGRSIAWNDRVRGPSHIETSSLSDPVLVRGDGTMLYTFASVVDDADMGVSLVLRGEDHVANTAVQIELFEALGAKPPAFGHHNLIAAADGSEMSKRTGALSIRSFREAGLEPMALASVAVLAGTSESLRAVKSLAALQELAELGKFSRALTKFDPAEIAALSARLLHERPHEEAAAALAAMGVPESVSEKFWLAVRGNLARIEDAGAWRDAAFGAVTPVIAESDRDFITQARGLLPPEPWDENTWSAWTVAVKAASARSGKSLFMPLRLALTGLDHGPELKLLLPLVGRARTVERLS